MSGDEREWLGNGRQRNEGSLGSSRRNVMEAGVEVEEDCVEVLDGRATI